LPETGADVDTPNTQVDKNRDVSVPSSRHSGAVPFEDLPDPEDRDISTLRDHNDIHVGEVVKHTNVIEVSPVARFYVIYHI
jgi:hypothetical protein